MSKGEGEGKGQHRRIPRTRRAKGQNRENIRNILLCASLQLEPALVDQEVLACKAEHALAIVAKLSLAGAATATSVEQLHNLSA